MSDVSTVSPEMAELHDQIKIIDALMGGTPAMRAAQKTYLPQYPLESDGAYKCRLEVSTLHPAFEETVNQMAGRVFFKAFDKSSIAKSVEELMVDVDLRGNELEVFMHSPFVRGVCYGRVYVIVDYSGSGEARTLADEKQSGARPYFTMICPKQVLAAPTKIINGREQFEQFRYKHMVTEKVDRFTTKSVEEIVVIEAGVVERYRRDEKSNDWAEHSKSELKVNGKPLPMVNVIELRLDKRPPMQELAYLCVKHWQSQSDQDNIVHTARVPLLKRTGMTDDDAKNFQVGGSVVDLPPNADLAYVEHSGAAVKAGQDALDKLEEQMQAAGAKLTTRSRLALTDSQARDEQGKEISTLRAWANTLEDFIGRCLDLMAMWKGEKEGGAVEISGNIDADFDPNASMDSILKMNAQGIISKETTFEEGKRRGLLSEMADWPDEEVRLENDIPRPDE